MAASSSLQLNHCRFIVESSTERDILFPFWKRWDFVIGNSSHRDRVNGGWSFGGSKMVDEVESSLETMDVRLVLNVAMVGRIYTTHIPYS